MDSENPDDGGLSLEENSDHVATPDTPKGKPPSNQSIARIMFVASSHIKAIIILLLIILLGVGAALLIKDAISKHSNKTVVINTQSLSNGTLNKVTSQLGNEGQVSTQLTITPSTLFKNSVEIQGKTTTDSDLDVGGNFNTKGSSNLYGPVNARSSLAVQGSGSYGGNLSVTGLVTAASLSVGSINISTINLSGDINVGGHIIPSGAVPSVSASAASSGGSATITGNDTAGTVTINIGAGKTVAGELAIITFHKAFATTPKVQLTPLNSASAQIFYYVSQSPTFFTVNSAGMPANGASYTFNYLVTQ